MITMQEAALIARKMITGLPKRIDLDSTRGHDTHEDWRTETAQPTRRLYFLGSDSMREVSPFPARLNFQRRSTYPCVTSSLYRACLNDEQRLAINTKNPTNRITIISPTTTARRQVIRNAMRAHTFAAFPEARSPLAHEDGMTDAAIFRPIMLFPRAYPEMTERINISKSATTEIRISQSTGSR